jgi:hypothetical protein
MIKIEILLNKGMKYSRTLTAVIALISCAFLSCSEKSKGADSKIFTEKAVSDFIRIHSDWDESKGTEAATDEKFKHMMINLSNEKDFLKELPFQLKELRDTTINNETYKVGVFQLFEEEQHESTSLLNDLQLQVLGLMHDEKSSLTVGTRYTVTGTVFRQGKRAGVFREVQANRKIYHLGKYTFFITAAKEVK